ncbi:unnamed protein product, partial [Brassica rapa subsp. narinosa]
FGLVGGVRVGSRSKFSVVEGVVLPAKLSSQFRTGSTDQHVNDVAVTSPEGTRREKFRVRRPMTAWRKGKMLNDNEHGVPSGPNPISNR